ncbi:MAG: Hsp33 family molecular chaperone HslO [Bdellovibrio sp.]|nr:Hsp33 family molecular chaperone HslO [Methylotenera sp.]
MAKFNDSLQHFLFEDMINQPMPIRGNIVHLNHTFRQVLKHQNLPQVLKQALGDLMTASVLLSSTLKMQGVMVLQLQSKGALKLLVVECRSDLKLRATAKWDVDWFEAQATQLQNISFAELLEQGQFVITLDPTEGEPYQGIVPIEGNTIAEMLQNYMMRSQQIDTSLWLHCDGENAAGMLLQKLPNVAEYDPSLEDFDAWNRVNHLANTLTNQELQNLAPASLLTRLFAEEDIRLFEAKPTQFYCSCSKTKVGGMLRMLGVDEVNSILTEQGHIDVNCDFCNKHYAFDAVDATALFASDPVVNLSKSTH